MAVQIQTNKNRTKFLTFHNTQLNVIDQNGQPWVRANQIGLALEYKNPELSIAKLFRSNAEEFTDNITALIDLPTNGGIQQVRIFSLRGAHLLAMFARTKVAKEFRKWVLDILDLYGAAPVLSDQVIGTTGFNCLAAVLEGKVKHLPGPVKRQAKQHVWAQVHKAFSVVSAQDIPANQMDAARAFIGGYAIEGEYLPRGQHHYPASYWKRYPVPGMRPEKGEFGIPEGCLCGEAPISPISDLLLALQNEGHNIEACRQELLAMRHYLDTYIYKYRFANQSLSTDLLMHYDCLVSHFKWVAKHYRDDLKPALECLNYPQRHNLAERMVAVTGQALQIESLIDRHHIGFGD